MKEETLLDILIYLFETYTDEDSSQYMNPKVISREMIEAGFHPKEVNNVLHWFNDLTTLSMDKKLLKEDQPKLKTIRIFSKDESMKISNDARNYLLYLEHIGVINMAIRELIIDRSMALEIERVEVQEIKWLAFMILFKGSSRRKIQSQMLATLILDGDEGVRH